MRQLTGLDTAFLSMETDTTFGHINSLSIYERPTCGTPVRDLVRSQIDSRLGLLTPFRRRLVEVPFDIDRPWWIEDPAFDLDFHVRHLAVPSPGGTVQINELVADIISRPLDRSHPLWETYVIEGLEGDRWALLLKIHHAAVDGAAGAELLTNLLDTEPQTSLPENLPPVPSPERVPSDFEMLQRSALNWMRHPQNLARANARLWSQAMSTGIAAGGKGRRSGTEAIATTVPRTPFNRSISRHRRFAHCSTSLDIIRQLKTAFGVTVNDVVMAVCAGGLRRYLARHDQLPSQPLVAGVPVSIRSGDEADPWTNRVVALSARLPTHLADPAERLAFAHQAMDEAKGAFDLVPADALVDFAQFSPPAVAAQAAQAMSRLQFGDRVAPMTNLIVSNVPGPRQALFLGTARLVHYFPVSTIAEGQGLNITVQSYEDKLDIGLVACRRLMPDLDSLLEDIEAEITDLASLLGPTLDPAAKRVIDMTASAIANGVPPMWELSAPDARAAYRQMSLMLGPGDEVDDVRNQTIPGPGGDLPVRIYRPTDDPNEALPATVFYHGGGFVIGDLDTHDRECRRIARLSGGAVISVDYRLAPEHPFPAATDDAWAALEWVLANSDALGVDSARVAVAGDSAGGNLAAVTALRARDEGIDLAFQALIYPAVDVSEGVDDRYPSRRINDGLVLSETLNDWFITAYVGAEGIPVDPRLTPIDQNLDGVAPALVITAGCDPLRDEGQAYAEALAAAGVDVRLTEYPGQIHGFFSMGPAIPAGWDAVAEVAATLAAALHPSPGS